MKRKLIELLIKWWMPKYHLARTRGPYRKSKVVVGQTPHPGAGD